jgi:hypothetical protein
MQGATLGLPPIMAACLRLAFRCCHVLTVTGYRAIQVQESKPVVSCMDMMYLKELRAECRLQNQG